MKDLNRTNDRVFLGELDSVRQAESVPSVCEPGAAYGNSSNPKLLHLLGRLRFELLLSERLVLSDHQVFDGRLFLSFASAGLLKRLDPGRDDPVLEIRCRQDTVAGTLLDMFSAHHGKPYKSSFLSNGSDVMECSRQVSAAESAHQLLKDSGCIDKELEAMSKGWRAVNEAIEQRHVKLVTWDRSRTWERMTRLSDDYFSLSMLAAAIEEDSTVDKGVADIVRELSKHEYRSEFEADERFAHLPIDVQEMTRNWFNERHLRTIAFQHEADYRSYPQPGFDDVFHRRLVCRDEKIRTTEVNLPSWFIDRLGYLEADEWRACYSSVRKTLVPWWLNGSKVSLGKSLEKVCIDLEGASGLENTRSGSSGVFSFGLKVAGEVARLPLEMNLAGMAGVLVVVLGEYGLSRILQDSGLGLRITDYLDDVNCSYS